MKNVVAYIDEYGNSGLDFENIQNSTHFIVTSILIEKSDYAALEKELNLIRKKYFQNSEIKSSKVGANDNRREKILRDLCELDFFIYSVVVDKRELYSEGFKYKKSFYKFIHSLVDRELFKTFRGLEIVADEHGSNNFMLEFIEYIKKNHIPNLFQQSSLRFVNSKELSPIQISDFISGTLARCFDSTKLSQKKDIFLSILKPKIIHIKEWPTNYNPYTYEPSEFPDFNPVISELGLNLADQFLDKYSHYKEPAIFDQITCLKYLLFHFRNISPVEYISTFELINRISKVRNSERISIHYFRSKIIAKLRDKGVIISSSPKGYKLPTSERDIYDFINHSNLIIEPMISRIKRARELILLATMNKLDILDKKEYDNLRKLI